MRIAEVELLANDLDAAEKFYAGLLGFVIESRNEQSITFKVGYSTLTFIKTEIKNPVYHFAFEIPITVFEQSVEWMKGKSELVQFENGSVIVEFTAWNAKSIYFYDLNGNITEFIARTDVRSNDKAFDTKNILGICEMAFVSGDIQQLAVDFIKKGNLSYYSKQSPMPAFAALGDDKGLIILVAENRIWFSTKDLKAQKFWAKVRLEIEGKLSEFQY